MGFVATGPRPPRLACPRQRSERAAGAVLTLVVGLAHVGVDALHFGVQLVAIGCRRRSGVEVRVGIRG